FLCSVISFFFLRIPQLPTSTLFPTRRSSDLHEQLFLACPRRVDIDRGEQPLLGEGSIEAELHVPGALELFEDDLVHTGAGLDERDRKSTRLNSSHGSISYAVFCLKKKKKKRN